MEKNIDINFLECLDSSAYNISDVLPENCEKEAIDLGATYNEVCEVFGNIQSTFPGMDEIIVTENNNNEEPKPEDPELPPVSPNATTLASFTYMYDGDEISTGVLLNLKDAVYLSEVDNVELKSYVLSQSINIDDCLVFNYQPSSKTPYMSQGLYVINVGNSNYQLNCNEKYTVLCKYFYGQVISNSLMYVYFNEYAGVIRWIDGRNHVVQTTPFNEGDTVGNALNNARVLPSSVLYDYPDDDVTARTSSWKDAEGHAITIDTLLTKTEDFFAYNYSYSYPSSGGNSKDDDDDNPSIPPSKTITSVIQLNYYGSSTAQVLFVSGITGLLTESGYVLVDSDDYDKNVTFEIRGNYDRFAIIDDDDNYLDYTTKEVSGVTQITFNLPDSSYYYPLRICISYGVKVIF